MLLFYHPFNKEDVIVFFVVDALDLYCFLIMVKKKELGSTLSMVHGKKKEIICHDMRKYVWQQNEQISKRNKKKKRP